MERKTGPANRRDHDIPGDPGGDRFTLMPLFTRADLTHTAKPRKVP
jgi:hypothetical protein